MIENFDNKNIQSFEYETSINSDGNIAGTCELGNATIQMLNDSNEYSSLKGQWIKTIHGSFYIHNVEPVQEKVNIKLSCYDVKYKLDIQYDSSLYTWPMTLKEWRNQIGTNCGITFDNSDFPNSNLILNEEPYIGDNPSNRTVVSIIAQAGCSWVDTDKDDIFYFNWFDNTIHIVNDWIELTTEKEMSSPINVVVLGRGDVEDNVKWPEILPANPVEFRIDNNYILDPQESTEDKRYDVIETIYNRVNGFKYLVFNIRTQDIFNKLSIKLGQIVTYRDMWGNVLSANVMSKKITYLGGNLEDDDNYEITLSTEEIKETSTEYSYASSIENKLRKTQITVDKQNQRIEAIASDINENAEKVASLEITTGNISTKVSSVETDLSTTKTNLSNLSNTVDTLSDDINGVSADFEDFKDNEYIQSIDNLQKQIDGAIQFWNGAEIPTLENYPANEWTTENDKINHQADIYTVVQDVQGEMKQGKSYRFDKVGGVWQWIELTDNELSAVQAIAQEALDKANANATEIGTVKTRVSSLEQTDEQIKASVESINKQIIPTATATGSNIYIEDASDDPLIQLEIEGKSTQETRSGKNLLDLTKERTAIKGSIPEDNFTLSNDTLTVSTPFYQVNDNIYGTEFNVKKNTNYILSYETITGRAIVAIYDSVGNKIYENNNYIENVNFNSGDNEKLYVHIRSNGWLLETTLKNVMISTNGGDYEPYGASPSPDYPSEIESVGYENLAYLSLKNGNVQYLNNASAYTDYIFEAGTYTLIYNSENPLTAYIRGESDTSNTNLGTGKEITFTKNEKFNLWLHRSGLVENEITDLQLTKGSQQHSYIPYGKYGIEVETIGKNLWGNLTWQTSTYAYFKLPKDDDYYTLSIKLKDGVTIPSDLYLGFTEKGIYENGQTVYWLIQSGGLVNYKSKDNFYYMNNLGYLNYISVFPANYAETLNEYFDIQLEESQTFTSYMAYQKNISLITLNAPLRSLPNGVKDIAYTKNNRLYVDRYVGSVVLNGSESWGTDGSLTNTARYRILTSLYFPNCIGQSYTRHTMSDYFTFLVNYNSDTPHYYIGNADANSYFFISKTLADTLDAFKTWLSEHPTQVNYELATPITEELGEIEIPSTFKGINHISTTDELEPTLNIEYVRDTILSNYVEGQINKVMTIEERHYSELVIEDDNIKASVTEVSSNLSEMTEDIHTVQETLTSTEKTIEVISTNIDKTTGEIREVTTINGYKLNKDGLNIYTNENSFNTLIDNEGTYYKDGDAIISETTKDGFMATSIKNKGSEEYCYDESNKVYDFVKERIEVDGEYGYATFYNGVN